MGLLVNGEWTADPPKSRHKDGRYVRAETQFRNWITPDGSPGESGKGGFAAEGDRYHLFISLACPWAHRTLLFRSLKGLQDMIGVSVADPRALETGWDFTEGWPDHELGVKHLYEVYQRADSNYTGRVSVPVLWDKKLETIVSNESSEIIRMFNSAFDHLGAKKGDYYPAELRAEIGAINQRVYDTVNNGVYRSGFARTQEAYEEAVTELFQTLDHLEDRLSRQRYLVGSHQTEADWRLFATLIRFDAVYYSHFKCNIRRIIDYPNLSDYVRELYQVPGVAELVDIDHIKTHYFYSHESINPKRIIPVGPELDFSTPHDRDRFPRINLVA